MAKFSVGEIAIVAACPERGVGPQECEVMATPCGRHERIFGYFKQPETYLVQIPGFHSGIGPGYFQVQEKHLSKRPHKGLPESITRIFEIKEIA